MARRRASGLEDGAAGAGCPWELFDPAVEPPTMECLLDGAIAFPIRIGGQIVGVLEFFTRVIAEPDAELVRLFDSLGTVIGQFVERRNAAEVRERLAAIVDCSDDAIVSKTLDGIITSWNRGAEQMFGYTADEAVGRHITLIVPAELHGEEEEVFGDAGYSGADKRPELADRDVSWNIAIRRSIIKALPQALRELAEPVERALAQVRAVVEHPFHIVKNRFHHKKLHYRGLHKNTAQLYTLFALANLVIVKQVLLAQPGR